MQQVVATTLGSDFSIGWTGSAYQELATAGSGSLGFVFGLVMVFLILAAQYERWSLPIAVLTGGSLRRAGRPGRDLGAAASTTTSTSDRAGHADRPCRQERHPDRRSSPRSATAGALRL